MTSHVGPVQRHRLIIITLETGIMISFSSVVRSGILRLLWEVEVDRTSPRMRIRGFQRFKACVGGLLVMTACMTRSMNFGRAGMLWI